MVKYEYMVVYSFKQGVGRVKITTEETVESYDDVEKFDRTIEEHSGFKGAFATDFKLLRAYED